MCYNIMPIHHFRSTNKRFHVPRSVRASVRNITISAHQALTTTINTSIACFGFVIIIELYFASYIYIYIHNSSGTI